MPELLMDIVEINSVKQFNSLMENNLKTPIVIDFWAPWCGPCKIFHPVFVQAHKKWGDFFIFARVNTEANPVIASQLGIQSIPMLGFVKNNTLIHNQAGALRRPQLDLLLERVKNKIQNEGSYTSSMFS